MKSIYIAIEREYGSAGTEIAKQLSDVTSIPCYGKEILEKTSAMLNIPAEHLFQYEEKVTGSVLYSLYIMGQIAAGSTDMLTSETRMTITEHAVIQQLAQQGSGIFLGHCACEALKDKTNVITVFIHADENAKRQRIAEEYRIPEDKIDRTMKKFDKKRANYYYANTGRQWHDMNQYDIVLDSSKLGIAKCVKLLASLIE